MAAENAYRRKLSQALKAAVDLTQLTAELQRQANAMGWEREYAGLGDMASLVDGLEGGLRALACDADGLARVPSMQPREDAPPSCKEGRHIPELRCRTMCQRCGAWPLLESEVSAVAASEAEHAG